MSNTTNSAASKILPEPKLRPEHRASTATLNMYSVRCTGTSKPASKAYAQATSPPASKAALGAGRRSIRHSLRRHSQPTSPANKAASIVTCRPLIDTRCVTPVRLKSVHCALGIAR